MMIRLLAPMLLTSAITLAAPITLTLQNVVLSGAPGGAVTFVATATNTTAVTQNLNADSFTLQAPLVLNDSLYNSWPLALNGSLTFGPQGLFAVSIPSATALGLYNGVFNIVGGPGANDQLVLGTTNFQVNVVSASSIPEPASGLLLLIGGAFIPLLRRHSRFRGHPLPVVRALPLDQTLRSFFDRRLWGHAMAKPERTASERSWFVSPSAA